ncbi:alpha/beta fold hydrolase [Pelovirga terrestris]|uniref:Alpha/beta hydrolase n=1 Tax=Pelovirga terrestris TaxID=2771352 RepID=A0A8J6QQU2_9BACT|nr:alpha/beta hydrolase [Pelovirga terrestris]MBD1401531.1 alpha/beta hydrolase [Pelovirga terrestris]
MICSTMRISAVVVLMLLGWPGLTISAPAQSPWQQEQLLQEPIFNGHFFLREAGSEHQDILLLVHGLGDGASDIWEPFVAELAESFHVIAPDLPGFGRSSKANQLYSPANYAEFAHWLLDRHPGKPVYLVGHSLGGAISLHVAARHSGRLERLILVDAVGTLHRLAVSQNLVRDLINLDLPFFSTTVESTLGRIAGLVLEKTARVPLDPDLLLVNAAAREKFLAGDPARIAALALVQSDFSLLLPRITTPTWLIWGDQDQIAPLRIATILDWNLTDSRLRLLYGLDHIPMNEDPQRFMGALQQALLDNKPDSAPLATPVEPVDAVCDQQRGRVFSGNFATLQIDNCSDVLIHDAQVAQLITSDSQVTIERSLLGNDAQGIAVQTLRSTLTLTGVDIKGRIGMQMDQSRIDLAGGRFLETPLAVMAVGNPSSILFSSSIKRLNGQLISLQLSRGLGQGESF